MIIYDHKKIYTVQINDVVYNTNIWYYKKTGQQFEATLEAKELSNTRRIEMKFRQVVFKVDDLHIIHPIDCKVISERMELSTEPVVQKVRDYKKQDAA